MDSPRSTHQTISPAFFPNAHIQYVMTSWINTVYKPYMNFQRHSCFYDKSDRDLLDQMGISNQRAHSPFIMDVICWQDQRKRTHRFWTLFWNFFTLGVLKVHCISQTTYLLLSHQKQTWAIDDLILSELTSPQSSRLIKVFTCTLKTIRFIETAW